MIFSLFFLLLAFSSLALILLGGDANKKAHSETAISRKSAKKIINSYILTRLGVKSK